MSSDITSDDDVLVVKCECTQLHGVTVEAGCYRTMIWQTTQFIHNLSGFCIICIIVYKMEFYNVCISLDRRHCMVITTYLLYFIIFLPLKFCHNAQSVQLHIREIILPCKQKIKKVLTWATHCIYIYSLWFKITGLFHPVINPKYTHTIQGSS